MTIKTQFITLKKVILIEYHCNTFKKYNANGIAMHFYSIKIIINGKTIHYFQIQSKKNSILLTKLITIEKKSYWHFSVNDWGTIFERM